MLNHRNSVSGNILAVILAHEGLRSRNDFAGLILFTAEEVAFSAAVVQRELNANPPSYYVVNPLLHRLPSTPMQIILILNQSMWRSPSIAGAKPGPTLHDCSSGRTANPDIPRSKLTSVSHTDGSILAEGNFFRIRNYEHYLSSFLYRLNAMIDSKDIVPVQFD
jgi:hypothetical protein